MTWTLLATPLTAVPQNQTWSVHGLVDLPMYFWDGVILAMAVLVAMLLWFISSGRRTAQRLERTTAMLGEAVAGRDEAIGIAKEREALFRHLFDQTQVGIFRSAVEGDRLLVANRALARMFGYDSVELFLEMVRPSAIYDHPDQRAEVIRILKERGEVGNFEIAFTRPDGRRGVLLASMYLDAAEGWIEGSVLDITALQDAHAEVERQHAFLQTLLNAIPNPIFYKDAGGAYRLVNEAFVRMLGMSEPNLIGKTVHDISPPDLARKYEEMDNALLLAQGKASQRYDFQVKSEQGLRSVVFFKESILDSAGAVRGLVGTISDVTQLRDKERELELATARYRNILENAVEGIAEFSARGEFLDVNPALARMLGYMTPAELLADAGRSASDFYVEPVQRDAMVESVRREGRIQRFEMLVRRRDGGESWLSLSLNGVFDASGELVRMHGLALDVTKQRAEHEELARMASTDILTGLANRAAMLAQLDRMLTLAGERGLVLGVLYMDLDGFKEINDQWGHQAGDEVLVQVAGRLRRRLRGSDVLARMGGDEFAILLWDLGAERNLQTVAQAVLRDMGTPFACRDGLCELGASLGGSLFPDHAQASSELLALADQAMYRVKREGKNGFCQHGREPACFEPF